LLIPATVLYAGEHQRRFSVEVALLAGDNRLLLEDGLSSEKRQWIEGRITSSKNVLPLLTRYYVQESGFEGPSLFQQVEALSRYPVGSHALQRAVMEMRERFPVQFAVDLNKPLDSLSKRQVKSDYEEMCLGCHITTAQERSVVIGEFGAFARSMTDDEWLARLLGGLRGDSYTALENPFTDTEITRFFRYIRDELP
ncbi:MAG: hypothetical protein OQK68_02795, partial [Sedimenticola sp.]|nr:hypothetical protein [Sedimenticola sp.]